jgi:hypothetical protein
VLCAQTLIKIITGEHKSSGGTVWRHPNLRMAYVAQHAFHHLEEHLDTTPLKYMFKRFGLGTDQVRQAQPSQQLVAEQEQEQGGVSWQSGAFSVCLFVCVTCLPMCGPALYMSWPSLLLPPAPLTLSASLHPGGQPQG